MTEQEPRIFLCHAHEDKPRVRELYHQLKEAGYHPWLDEKDLLPGQEWWAEIRKVIGDPYNLVVVCLSANSITKRGTVQREIKWALDELEEMPEGTIYLIPARLEDCPVPERLAHLHWVDLFQADGFEPLRRALGLELGKRQRAPKPTPVTLTRQPFEPELIHIPAGQFLMGSDPRKDKDTPDEEQPQHHLSLPDYYIAKTPLTNAQYGAFLKATDQRIPTHWEGGKPPAGKEDHPVVNVSWHDAVAYCQWLAKVTGKAYRLPSEAEWEKAARGTDGRSYPWGDDPPDETRCNFDHNVEDTTPVGHYSPGGDSPYACVDMAGNVWEWTLSQWGKGWAKPDFKYPYDPQDGRENLEAGDDIARMCRGGAFCHDGRGVRCAVKSGYGQSYRNDLIGFRVCVAAGQA